MTIPMAANTTCDIYRSGKAPPANPDGQGVTCHLQAAYYLGLESGEDTSELDSKFTHRMLVESLVDIRDGYTRSSPDTADGDTVYVPDLQGTRFLVVYVEVHLRGSPSEHKEVYLRRTQPNWPTQEL